MASILKVDALQGITSAGDITVTSEGGAATQSLQQGLAKSWVNFNGTGTVAVRDSENVTSILDEGTGDYTVNFTNSMANANYNSVASGQHGLGQANRELRIPGDTNPTTSAVQLWTITTAPALIDFAFVSVSNHGDLA